MAKRKNTQSTPKAKATEAKTPSEREGTGWEPVASQEAEKVDTSVPETGKADREEQVEPGNAEASDATATGDAREMSKESQAEAEAVAKEEESGTAEDAARDVETPRNTADAATSEEANAPGDAEPSAGGDDEEAPLDAKQDEATENTGPDTGTESDAAASAPPPPALIEEKTEPRSGGFVPLVLGGIVAAGIGYGAAAISSGEIWPFASEDDAAQAELQASLERQNQTIASLEERLTGLQEGVDGIDLGSLEAELSDLDQRVEALRSAQSALTERVEALAGRIDTLEKQPMEQAVSPEAIAAYERALDDLRAEVDAQRAEVARMAEEAVAAEQSAEQQSRLAESRAALAEITAALESGAPFDEAVEVLAGNGVEVPAPLNAVAADGVATRAELVDAFPELARDALAEARSVATQGSEGANRVTTFLRNQLGARSVTPREGSDPDAILSRAEAAVRNGNLAQALDEIARLPDVARAVLADWQVMAETRLNALTAADALSQQLVQE